MKIVQNLMFTVCLVSVSIIFHSTAIMTEGGCNDDSPTSCSGAYSNLTDCVNDIQELSCTPIGVICKFPCGSSLCNGTEYQCLDSTSFCLCPIPSDANCTCYDVMCAEGFFLKGDESCQHSTEPNNTTIIIASSTAACLLVLTLLALLAASVAIQQYRRRRRVKFIQANIMSAPPNTCQGSTGLSTTTTNSVTAFEDSVAREVKQHVDEIKVDEEDISYGMRAHEELHQESLEKSVSEKL